MSTKTIHKGASNNVSGATAPTVLPVPTPGPATDLTASQWLTVETAVKNFREGYAIILAALQTGLQVVPDGFGATARLLSAPRKEAAGLYAGLLQQYPDLTAKVSPGVIEAALAVNAALLLLESDLQQPLLAVKSCAREAGQVAWSNASIVRSAAKSEPHKTKQLAASIASIEALLRVGKRVSLTADVAARAQTAATKAQQNAAKAAAKAARAAQTAERTAQAHAAHHPPPPDVVIVPAGTTGTTPKG